MTKKQSQSTKRSSYGKLAAWLLAGATLVIGGIGGILISQEGSKAANVVIYKSPTCGCCSKWVSHLQENGYSVEVHDRRNMNPIKREMGVPPHLQSCHTATVGDYVVEGHVPADVIVRMLREKPDIKGLAVPGMPMGSPGMKGPRKDPYDILAFQENGRTRVYASR